MTTTEIYLHVATGVHGLGVVNPLDQIGGPSPTFLTGPPAEVLDAA